MGEFGTGLGFFRSGFKWRRSPKKNSVPDQVRVYAIGDVHGRADLLEELHSKMLADALHNPAQKIIQVFLGDYVDRGDDSRAVIDWLLAPTPEGWERICLKGNHEAMVLDFLDNSHILNDWRKYGGLETLHSYGVDLTGFHSGAGVEKLQIEFRQKLPESHLAFFTDLSLYKEIGDYFFTHAGVHPGHALSQQKEQDLLWIRDDFLTSQMDFGKIIVHGHTPVEHPEVLANRINIDTGAFITGNLTCLVLDGEEQRFL